MSYESRFENEYKNYKVDFIELLDEVEEGRLSVLPDMRVELDVVYAQAAKADEYEAKAKAWDKLMFEIDEINDEATVKGVSTKITMVAKLTALYNAMKECESDEL